MNELLETLGSLDWSPLFITLRTGFFATLVCFFLGVIAANGVMRLDGRAAAVLDSLFTLPMILPPTAMGFLLLLLFSRRRTLGEFLYERFGITIITATHDMKMLSASDTVVWIKDGRADRVAHKGEFNVSIGTIDGKTLA